MTKKMRELMASIKSKTAEARKAKDEGKLEDCKKLLDDIEALQDDFNLEQKLYHAEKEDMDPDDDETPGDKKKIAGIDVIMKMIRKQPLDSTEKALVTGGTSGEDNLIPEDVNLQIVEMRKQFKSAKDLVTVIPTSSMEGGINVETGEITELADLTDGDEPSSTDKPSFARKTFSIALKSALIPISNILKGLEKAGLMVYIRNWFVKKAIRTENRAIFARLKTAKSSPTSLTSWRQLRTAIGLLDPDALIDGVVVTNQTGFNALDDAVDALGKPLLQPDPTQPTKMLFKGLPVHVFSNADLQDVGGKAPFFFGSLKAALYFIELNMIKMSVSEHYLFGKNQTALMFIEGFDMIAADVSAYEYGLLDVTEYQVKLTIKKDGTAVEGASVKIAAETVLTGADGVAIFNLPNGNYNYTVTGAGLQDATGNFGVYGAKVSMTVAVTAAE